MIYGLIFNTTCLFIRAVYRTIELSDGWKGRIISTQLYFNVLDGAMVTMAIYTLNFTHPGFLLRDSLSDARSSHPSLVPDEEKKAANAVNVRGLNGFLFYPFRIGLSEVYRLEEQSIF